MKIKTFFIENNLCEDNEYLDKYISLIEDNLNTKPIKNKTQVHHILPRAAFKSLNESADESDDNKINLSFKDHVLAHYYLSLCGKGKFRYSNEYALLGMSHRQIIDNSFLDELDKLDLIYQEIQKHNSEYHKNKRYSKETIKKRADKIRGHIVTEITRKKISNKNTGKYLNHKFLNKDNIEIRVPIDLVESYIQDGWLLGRSEKTKKSLSNGYNYNSKGMLGKHQSEYQKQRAREANLGPKNQAFKDACRNGRLNKTLVSNDSSGDTKYVPNELVEEYISKGYRKGRLHKNN